MAQKELKLDSHFEPSVQHHEARLRRKRHSDKAQDGGRQWELTGAQTQTPRFQSSEDSQATLDCRKDDTVPQGSWQEQMAGGIHYLSLVRWRTLTSVYSDPTE